MAGTTPNYGLATGVAADDIVEASHHNRVADTVDRALGGFLGGIMNRGAHRGWEAGTDKQVVAGEGLVGACWCRSTEAQAIGGLTNGAVNYVYATVDETSAPDGTVHFVGQLAPPGPSGAVFLGLVELDAEGVVTLVDNDAEGVQRHCHALRFGQLAGSGTVEGVQGGQVAAVTVDHSAAGEFRVPGDLRVEAVGEVFRLAVVEHHRGDRYKLEAENTGSEPADLEYAWTREGVLRQ
jgi:hypothetical protein